MRQAESSRTQHPPPPRSRLQTRIVFALIAILIVTMSSVAAVNYRFTRDAILADLQRRSEQVAQRLQNALAIPLWSYNEETASGFIEAEMADPGIIAIVVQEHREGYEEQSSGEPDAARFWIAYSRGKQHNSAHPVSSSAALEAHAQRAYGSVAADIHHQELQIGTTRVYYSDSAARAEIRAQLRSTAAVTAVLGVALAAALSVLLNRMVVHPLQNLLRGIDNVASGDYRAIAERHRNDEIGELTRGFERMVATVARREQELLNAVEDKAAMLREIHHRVKNNFQILSSLLGLQNENLSEEARSALQESRNRIRSMAMAHEKLYETSSLARITFDQYLRELVEMLRVNYGVPADTVRIDTVPVALDLDTAVPLGLLLNEAVSNAFKHAYHEAHSPIVSIGLQRQHDADRTLIVLTIEDNGPGFPSGFDLATTEGLGLRLISALTEQVNGALDISSQHGAQLRIRFPVRSAGGTAPDIAPDIAPIG